MLYNHYYIIKPQHLVLNFLWAFKSTTITEILSLLPFLIAMFDRYSAAACAAGSTPWPLSVNGLLPFLLCQIKICFRASSHTSSFDITSHRPSLAKTRHSSSLALGTNITSGSGIIHGFKYLSPDKCNGTSQAYKVITEQSLNIFSSMGCAWRFVRPIFTNINLRGRILYTMIMTKNYGYGLKVKFLFIKASMTKSTRAQVLIKNKLYSFIITLKGGTHQIT